MNHRFKNLKIWHLGLDITDEVFGVISDFPESEKFGLTSQVSRSSISIPSNIAEGSAMSDKSFKHYLDIALGSSFELETQLLIAKRRDYINEQKFKNIEQKIQEFQKMTIGFKNSL